MAIGRQVNSKARGFTIVEVLVVIVLIGILAELSVVAYNGITGRARIASRQNDLRTAQNVVETYYIEHGEYPKTTDNAATNWRALDVRTDANCDNGSSQTDWIPGVDSALPQSVQTEGYGVDHIQGCYLYASNGENYVISAWNMVAKSQTSLYYRRLGFREFQTNTSTQFYTCNSNTVGGATNGYDSSKDYYKHSYTLSNITDCNETPPPGA